MTPPEQSQPDTPEQKPAFCIIGESKASLFGLSGSERLRKQFRRAGLEEELLPANLAGLQGKRGIIIARAEGALDQPLVPALLENAGLVLVTEAADGSTPVAAHVPAESAERTAEALVRGFLPNPVPGMVRTPAQLEASFWKALRKRETPYALLVDADNKAKAEWRMFMGTYKGATDLVTKRVWPRPAFHATRFLAPRGISPNMVTSVAAVLTVLAFWLFLNGNYATGLVAAWAMTFLDTVDGKLARTTLTSSKWGDIFDHGIDLVHPPFWYAAWAFGLSAWGINWSSALWWWVVGIIMAGYVLQRVMEGISIKWLGLEIHIWRRIDTFFREITARRNPNLVILSFATLLGEPGKGLVAVAAWTAICLVLHGFQLIQAFAEKHQNGQLTSWMTRP